MSKKKRFIPIIILLGILAGYFTCILGFTHVHIVDGVRIVHSHPHHGDHEKDHHSQSELILLSDFSHIISTVPEIFSYNFSPNQFFTELLSDELNSVPGSILIGRIYLRGPPCL